MDIFDTGAYFSSKIPIMATTSPLLRSAACAIAAKQLYRSNRNPFESHLQHLGPVDWTYESARNYHEAIGHLREAVNTRAYDEGAVEKEHMLAAIAILCIFELMDDPGTAWKAHLSALPLFGSESDSIQELLSTVTLHKTAVKGPIFWILARQDQLCACEFH